MGVAYSTKLLKSLVSNARRNQPSRFRCSALLYRPLLDYDFTFVWNSNFELIWKDYVLYSNNRMPSMRCTKGTNRRMAFSNYEKLRHYC